ncbi:hypothetical protein MPER_10053, partial [Moniliophthora perniciosa FA553]
VWIIQFKEDRTVADYNREDYRDAGGIQEHGTRPNRQRGFKGHVMVYPQEPGKVAKVLPPSVEELSSPIAVIFVGKVKPSDEWLKTKARPLYVRSAKVRQALVWLKAHNPQYSDIEIDHGLLDRMPSEFILPVHIEVVPPSQGVDILTSRYDNQSENENHMRDDSNVDLNANLFDLKSAAIKHVKEKGLGYFEHAHGPEPVNEFYNPDLFPMMYPTLFPYGIGGLEDARRSVPVSIQRHFKHLVQYDPAPRYITTHILSYQS